MIRSYARIAAHALWVFCALIIFSATAQAQALEDWERSRVKAARDFSLKDLNGKTHRLSDYKGKVVIVNFWASWCPPCVDEMPSLQALKRTLDPSRVVILTVNSEDTASKAQRFLKRHKLDLTVLLDPDDDVGSEWDVEAYPSSFMLDARGRLRYETEGEIDFMGKETRRLIERLIDDGAATPSGNTAHNANPPIAPRNSPK